MIRPATEADIPLMTALADVKRAEYEAYAPTFWRRAEDAVQKQAAYFRAQLADKDTICLVSENEGRLDGFLIARIVTAPPVYDPGTLVCMVDDFAVATPDQWESIGKPLLHHVRSLAQSRGAGLAVVVCGHLDEAKREMLRASGFYIASEWYVSP